MKRYIRLKEHEPLSEQIGWPADAYPADASLERNRPFVIRADANGFVETGNAFGASIGSLVFLGDSVIENAMVDERHRICSHIERALYDHGLPVKVLNGGYSGATTLHTLNVLLNKIARLRPLAVVHVSGSVDIRVCCRPEKYWSPRAEITPLVNDGAEHDETNTEFDNVTLVRMLELFAQTGRTIDVPVWFSTTPVQRDRGSEYITKHRENLGDLDWFYARIDELNDVKRRLFKDGVRPFFDIDRALVRPETAFYDMSHFNRRGSGRVAAAFLTEGLLRAVRLALR